MKYDFPAADLTRTEAKLAALRVSAPRPLPSGAISTIIYTAPGPMARHPAALLIPELISCLCAIDLTRDRERATDYVNDYATQRHCKR